MESNSPNKNTLHEENLDMENLCCAMEALTHASYKHFNPLMNKKRELLVTAQDP